MLVCIHICILFLFQPVIEELKATGEFEMMDIRVDEAEHSMEMHLPYLAKVFEGYLLFICQSLPWTKLSALSSLII